MKLNEIMTKAQKAQLALSGSHKVELLDNKSSKEEQQKFIIDTLQKECHEVLSIYSKVNSGDQTKLNILWRGEGTEVKFYKNSIWKKRDPLWLSTTMHKASIDAFYKLGLKSNRENSIFCADISTASDWGKNVYAIFPTDGFGVTWFSKPLHTDYVYNILSDLPEEFAIRNKLDDNTQNELYSNKPDPHLWREFVDYVAKTLDSYEPINDHLDKALSTHFVNEYLVSGSSYYGVSSRFFNVQDEFTEKLFNV